MEKEYVLEVVYRCFARYGIKRVSMDSISSKLGISKRTLYERFNDKQQLVLETIGYECDRQQLLLGQICEAYTNPLERSLLLAIRMHEPFESHCDAFSEELACFPKAVACIKTLYEAIRHALEESFQAGVAGNILRAEQDYGLLTAVGLEHITDNHLSREDFTRLFRTLLRGCCTGNGLAQMEALQVHGAKKSTSRINN